MDVIHPTRHVLELNGHVLTVRTLRERFPARAIHLHSLGPAVRGRVQRGLNSWTARRAVALDFRSADGLRRQLKRLLGRRTFHEIHVGSDPALSPELLPVLSGFLKEDGFVFHCQGVSVRGSGLGLDEDVERPSAACRRNHEALSRLAEENGLSIFSYAYRPNPSLYWRFFRQGEFHEPGGEVNRDLNAELGAHLAGHETARHAVVFKKR